MSPEVLYSLEAQPNVLRHLPERAFRASRVALLEREEDWHSRAGAAEGGQGLEKGGEGGDVVRHVGEAEIET